ncbi:hypothetical protein CAOG_03007 [Capsaspora owczarzaki ATCC 30864]|uniref:HutD family protein n=1 Tax=Capsaspora owczarzaki (strain ATCC 30864) TaxID=595528 RepID=A0A0D2VNP0_CAPO3|nr:hypothetical protein CAOG_03007 [Capsaspora owczarzaki ATCC 30864]KJE91962.1 hypothetical protein CAOG_003007 [Capsaspora owczarzaki ATCC 30864]|eukprot:XP_004363846.1 hypothetical protein CAOG_03007 [Capsaspora owczarzaki ATCC 30864]
MTLRFLAQSDYRTMPWKNGLGTTTELAVSPAGASIDSFVWRISAAQVGAAGPFSSFLGVARTLLQTSGTPMTITCTAKDEDASLPRTIWNHTMQWLQPITFHGEEQVGCTRLDGVATDFNVMTRRAQCQSTTSVLELISGGYFSRVVPGATTCFVHALSGEIAVQVVSCSVGLVPTTHPSVCVRSHESAVLEPSAGTTKDSIVLEVHCAQHARFILVELTPSS